MTSVRGRAARGPGRHAPALPDAVWEHRHRWVTTFLAVFVLALGLWPALGMPVPGMLSPLSIILAVAALALMVLTALYPWPRLPAPAMRAVRAVACSVGCMGGASLAVALAGGVTEAHFAFFILLPVVALYETVLPFLVAVVIVVVEHGVVGMLWPHLVFGHMHGPDGAWSMAALHGVLFAVGCAGSLMAWTGARAARRHANAVVAELSHRARHDELTGLPNRTGLAQTLESALSGAPQDLAVVVVDLNRFKDVNDTLGHEAGDELLRRVARLLHGAVGEQGVLARLGGDEFAIVLPGADGPGACAVAEHLRDRVREGVVVAGVAVDVDLSAGVAVHRAGTFQNATAVRAACTELLRLADIAMYTAKRSGGGALVYDVATDHHSTAQLELARELRTAIARREELLVHYQPQVSLDAHDEQTDDQTSVRLVGVEALVRWQHPTRGFLPPSSFIPLLHDSDLAHPFTALMIEIALDQAQQWFLSGHEVPVAVNAFPRCLVEPSFVAQVAQALHSRGLAPHLLRLEITEDALMADPERAAAVVTELRDMGVATAVDDFGTGYSSLSYLRRLPVDEVKLDRSYVSGLGGVDGGGDEVLVASIVHLAHALGMHVVAEGVEHPEEVRVLRQLGCDTAQGYLFGKPAPADQLAPELLATARTSRRWQPGGQLTGEISGPASGGLGASSG
ncbi:diguanylate cyclase (GGDEF) domain-containing protein [Quadrisphaera granulorum]|uniref:Diguanylate cyclase (GGDEF)-like protein n=2 Tax=Quadrisphaera granulorum TaxID=317664 RepID=A0A316ARU4_9ACTN|nr:diguanylate cyclase (GGDEF)-like protein [Quadrisphaera granulorum]SZE97422.1 diguanylate cyclase (GGDEF) domain-containing protein [Quadrisphaera granulorum]